MFKRESIKTIYGIFLSVFVAAMGIATICVCADIYYSGAGTGVIYSREIISKRLLQLAPAFVVLIGAIIVGATFPVMEMRVKPGAEAAVRKLAPRLPAGGEGEEYQSACAEYKKVRLVRVIAYAAALCVTLAMAIVVLCYLCNTSNFKNENITAEILALVRVAMPCTAAALAAIIASSVLNGVFAKKQLNIMKSLIKLGDRTQVGEKVYPVLQSERNRKIALWVIRGAVLVIAISFIIAGALNGGARDVLNKAVAICTECIGLG